MTRPACSFNESSSGNQPLGKVGSVSLRAEGGNGPSLRAFFRSEDLKMRKVVSHLDEEQREAGTAAFSAGLIVAMLRGLVSLVT
jgi:hypothetical protein